MSIFDDYIASLNQGQSQTQTGGGGNNSMDERMRTYAIYGGQTPFNYDTLTPGGPPASPAGSGGSPGAPGGSGWIQSLYKPAFGYVQGGSQAAGGLLRQAYEDKFRARAAGFAGGQSEAARGFGSQMASQGLSGDVAARQLLAMKTGGLQSLAEARGEAGQGLNTDLATLAKGTGTELAGLSQSQVENMVNYIVGKQAASATENAGTMGALGSVIGGIFASDPRLKKNAVEVGVLSYRGVTIPIYEYAYRSKDLPGRYVGVMAPDVEFIPGVVSISPAGYQQVDYDLLETLTRFKFRKVASGTRKLAKV